MKAIKTILVILLILFGVFLIIQIQPLIPSSPSAEKEIAAAKKTTRNDNVLGIMLMNLDPTTS